MVSTQKTPIPRLHTRKLTMIDTLKLMESGFNVVSNSFLDRMLTTGGGLEKADPKVRDALLGGQVLTSTFFFRSHVSAKTPNVAKGKIFGLRVPSRLSNAIAAAELSPGNFAFEVSGKVLKIHLMGERFREFELIGSSKKRFVRGKESLCEYAGKGKANESTLFIPTTEKSAGKTSETRVLDLNANITFGFICRTAGEISYLQPNGVHGDNFWVRKENGNYILSLSKQDEEYPVIVLDSGEQKGSAMDVIKEKAKAAADFFKGMDTITRTDMGSAPAILSLTQAVLVHGETDLSELVKLAKQAQREIKALEDRYTDVPEPLKDFVNTVASSQLL